MKGKRSKQDVQEASMFISDLTDESLEKRVNAAKNLRFIAEVLGSDRIKTELLPFLRKGRHGVTQKWYWTRGQWWEKCWDRFRRWAR